MRRDSALPVVRRQYGSVTVYLGVRTALDPVTPARVVFVLIVIGLCMTGSAGAQSQPYYITDGDSGIAYMIRNGSVQFSFDTSAVGRGYPLAVTSTVVIGDIFDDGAVEYDLSGAPTGSTWTGGNNFSQLLDGTTDGVQYNYGAVCCGMSDSVTQASLTWESQTSLFDLPSGASGIAYDTTDGTLWVTLFDGTVRHYTLGGNELSQFTPGVGSLCCLAYDEPADTLWFSINSSGTIYEYSKAGSQLNSISVAGFSPDNQWGGEMPIGQIFAIFADGFESGDTSRWSKTVP